MWSEEPGMTNVLFDTLDICHDTQYNKPKYGEESFH